MKYEPKILHSNLNYLVVDGFLNNGPDSTFIRLSHTNKIDSGLLNTGEKNADMTIEDNSGNTLYHFTELTNGQYTLPALNLDINSKYRLRIKTVVGKEYVSDEIVVKETPPIDSITWSKNDRGVTVEANAHDAQGKSKYYRWEYTETYQYHSTFISMLKYVALPQPSIALRPDSEYIYTCWRTNDSKELLLASSDKLSEDIIYKNPIRFFSTNSIELSVKYSIFLRQFILTKEAYEYLQNLRRISEQIGSLFDAQPSQLTGNIHSLNNPDEDVLGYITAANMQTKRVYITNNDVKPWLYGMTCAQILVGRDPDPLRSFFAADNYIPISNYNSSPYSPVWAAQRECADCRILGGKTIKPDFWP